MLPWAKAHLNPTGQALIISTVAGMAYFIVADKTILSMARKHSFEDAPEQGFDTFLEWCIEMVGDKQDSAKGHFRHAGITVEEL